MDRGIKSLLLQSAIQMQLHVACALEFFEDQFVHSAAGFSQSSRQYRQAAALLRISRRAEKFLWLNERLRFDAPGHNPSPARLQIIVSARKTREAVEQDHHIVFHLDKTFGALQYHFSYLHMSLHAFVKIRMVNLAIDFSL